MCPAPRLRSVLFALLALAAGAGAKAGDGDALGRTPLIYGLTGSPAAEQSLLATRWSSPSLSLRLDTAAGLGPHEVRVLSTGSMVRLAPQLTGLGDYDAEPGWNIEPVRATYRYTLLSDSNWEMKLGLSANLGEQFAGLRPAALTDRGSFGSLPMVHFAGVGQWSPRWRLAFAVDGLATGRGRALDLGFKVDYLLSPSMSLFGGYQVTDAAGEAEPYYGSSLSNRANFGLNYRF
jgi:hypothetical protein